MRTLVALALTLALTGCATMDYAKSLFVTGVSLEALGEQFLQITDQVRSGCQSLVIPAPTCDRYKVFHDNFQKTYPLTVGMWQAADKAGDAATKGKAEDVARALGKSLAQLATEALSSFAPEVR